MTSWWTFTVRAVRFVINMSSHMFKIRSDDVALSLEMIQCVCVCVEEDGVCDLAWTRAWFCSHLTNATNLRNSLNYGVCWVDAQMGSVGTCLTNCRLCIVAEQRRVSTLRHELCVAFPHDSYDFNRLFLHRNVTHTELFSSSCCVFRNCKHRFKSFKWSVV